MLSPPSVSPSSSGDTPVSIMANWGEENERSSDAEGSRRNIVNYGAGSSRDNRLGAESSRSNGESSSASAKPLIGEETPFRGHPHILEASDDDDDETLIRRTDFESTARLNESRRAWKKLKVSTLGRAGPEDAVPLRDNKSRMFADVRIMAEVDEELHRNTSFPYLAGDGLKRPRTQEGSPLLRGPRRVLRLCLFAVLLPLALVLVPLYVRLIVYRPQVYAMAPSDQRLVDGQVSSIWCQGQGVNMNGSFNAYLVPHTPPTAPSRPRYTILKNLKMRDDVKEYWGFYLKGGSSVTLSMCTRHEGGQLLILRGSDNLHRCAWIGEEDSLEETQDRVPTEDDLKNLKVSSDADSDEYEDSRVNSRIGSRTFKAAQENINVETSTVSDDKSPMNFRTSEERQGHVSRLLSKALKMSKGKNELMDLLHAHQESVEVKAGSGVEDVTNFKQDNTALNNETNSQTAIDESERVLEPVRGSKIRTRTERAVEEEDRNGAYEVTDDEPEKISVKTYTKQEIGAEQIIGGLKIPDGLTYERGFVNQSHNNDLSREEHKSSYSSSEEALARCEGVILALAVRPDSQCSQFNHIQSNKISYEITVDGTYFFVFSSDNEIVVNDLYFNITLDKVVYDTTENVANCTASSNCSLGIGFWSDDRTVVEVPADDSFDSSFVLSTTCEPRVTVYLCFILMVPVMILFCALQ